MILKLLQIVKDSITNQLTAKAVDWIVSFGPRILIAIIIFFAGQWIIKMIRKAAAKLLSSRKINPTLRPFIQNLLGICLQAILIIAVMQIVGIKMTLFAAVLGAFGVAAGLALSGTLQNFTSGILILVMQPFRVGENIQTQGEKGTVMAIKLFYTVVRTFNNTTLIVPNGKLSNEVIFNLTREANNRLDISLKFPYKINFQDIQQMVADSMDSFKEVLKEPKYRIGVEKLEADGYTIVFNLWVLAHGFEDAKLGINEKLMEILKPIILNNAAA